MKVRLATTADIPAIQTLEKQADTAAHWSDDTYRSLFVAGSVPRVVLVTDDNGSVPGFVVARVVGDEWEIENIVVANAVRRRGIASALIHDLIKRAHAENVHLILLEVRQSNASGRKFYAKVGFVEYGRRTRYYQDPEEDALCYRLKLNPITGESAEP